MKTLLLCTVVLSREFLKFQARDVDDLQHSAPAVLGTRRSRAAAEARALQRGLEAGAGGASLAARGGAAIIQWSSWGGWACEGDARERFLWGTVLAPYGGDYYLAELVRVDSNGERGRVLFLDYDEYATVAMSELLEADETTVAGVLHMRLMGTVLLHHMTTIFRR